MANTQIKTRIILRNDTLANWGNSQLTLGKGEVAIATDNGGLAELRVGNNTTWANSLKLAVDPSQISGIVELIQGTAKKYQVVANGENGNSWKLQEAALSGGAWTDVEGSGWTIDFSAIENEITALTADVSYLSGQIDATNATLNTVSSDYLTSADKTELTNSIATKLASQDFADLSNTIGLSAATEINKVVTQKDIADLAGAMHFRGAVTPTEGETDLEALARVITDPASGDIAIITTTSREFVYNGTAWIELGAEELYATKAQVSVDIATAKSEANQYTDNAVAALSADRFALSADVDALVAEVSAATLTAANTYTDTAIAGLDVAASEAGNADAGFVTTVTETDGKVAVTKKTLQLSDITDVANISVDIGLSDYALSADVTALVSETSAATVDAVVGESTDLSAADTVYGAKAFATAKLNELVGGFLILDGGSSALRQDEPVPPFNA